MKSVAHSLNATCHLMLILLLGLPTITMAQSTDALVPIIGLILNEEGEEEPSTEFSCDFSITDISTAPGATIAEGDSVSFQFNYTLRNRPTGIRVEITPSLISSLEDLVDNFQQTQGLSLTSPITTLVDFTSVQSNISGEITIGRTNDGTNIGLTSRTFNDLLIFVTLSRERDAGGITVIGSNTFDCERRLSEAVNWTFTRD